MRQGILKEYLSLGFFMPFWLLNGGKSHENY